MRITFPFAGRVIERCLGGRDILQPVLLESAANGSEPSFLETCHVLGLRIGGATVPVETSPRILTATSVFRPVGPEGAGEPSEPESCSQERQRIPILVRVGDADALRPCNPRSVDLELRLDFSDGIGRHLIASGVLLGTGVLHFRPIPQVLASRGPARRGVAIPRAAFA